MSKKSFLKHTTALTAFVCAFSIFSTISVRAATTYGTGDSALYYKFQTDTNGYKTLVSATQTEAEIIVNYNSANTSQRLDSFDGSGVNKDFINYSTDTYDYNGGALYVTNGIKTGIINSNFASILLTDTQNIQSTNFHGGAIYSSGDIEKINGSL